LKYKSQGSFCSLQIFFKKPPNLKINKQWELSERGRGEINHFFSQMKKRKIQAKFVLWVIKNEPKKRIFFSHSKTKVGNGEST